MTAAVEDRTVRRGLLAEDQLLRNVIGALRRALDDHPDGCLEAALWHGVEACFVPRAIFNEAVDIMVYAGWALRAGGRLHAGLNRTDAARTSGRGQVLRALSDGMDQGQRTSVGRLTSKLLKRRAEHIRVENCGNDRERCEAKQ